MKDLQKSKEELPKLLLWINLIVLIVSMFYSKKLIYTLDLILNIIILGTYMIIKKFGIFFEGILAAKKLGNFANKLNSQLK